MGGTPFDHPVDFRTFHEINHPASLGYLHVYGNPHAVDGCEILHHQKDG